MKQMTLRSLCNFAGNSLLRNVVHLDKIQCFTERKRERERERERDTERHRETQRDTERHRETEIHYVENKIDRAKTRSPQLNERKNCATIRYRCLAAIVVTE